MAAGINHFRPMPLDTALERDATSFTNKVPRPLLARLRRAAGPRECLFIEIGWKSSTADPRFAAAMRISIFYRAATCGGSPLVGGRV